MYSNETLEKILNEKVYSIEETSYGVTNNNFIVTTNKNKYFYRTSKDSTKIVNKDNEKEALKLLSNEPYFLKPVYINNDKQLYVHFLINKDLNSGKLVHEGGGTSEKFSELMRNQK